MYTVYIYIYVILYLYVYIYIFPIIGGKLLAWILLEVISQGTRHVHAFHNGVQIGAAFQGLIC